METETTNPDVAGRIGPADPTPEQAENEHLRQFVNALLRERAELRKAVAQLARAVEAAT